MAWTGLTNKRILVFYNDDESVKRKEGFCRETNESFIVLNTQSGDIALPVCRVIRVEVLD